MEQGEPAAPRLAISPLEARDLQFSVASRPLAIVQPPTSTLIISSAQHHSYANGRRPPRDKSLVFKVDQVGDLMGQRVTQFTLRM